MWFEGFMTVGIEETERMGSNLQKVDKCKWGNCSQIKFGSTLALVPGRAL
jgi:hypothetical protein